MALAAGVSGCAPADGTTGPVGATDAARMGAHATAAERVTASEGAIIMRDAAFALFFNIDAGRGLVSLHIPVASPWLCGGGQLPNIVSRTRVTTPSDVDQFLVHIRDDHSAVGIYRAASLAEAGVEPFDPTRLCAFINGPAKVAEGIVRHVQNLSNASFSAHWQGVLTAPDGDPVPYSETYQLGASLHEPADPGQWRVHVSQIHLGGRE
jgi:hypothetical protein